MNSENNISIIIADDHAFFRSGLTQVLNKAGNYNLLAEAADGLELLELTIAHQPDLVIVDIQMPKLNGIQAVQKIKALNLPVAVIGLSMHTEEKIVLDMMQAGAMGYLDKNIDKEELYIAIESVVVWKQVYFPEKSSRRLFRLLEQGTYKPYPKQKIIFTTRELEVIQLTCKDLTNKEIADELILSKRTIETHRVRIMEKMKVKSVAGLVAYAFTNGIINKDYSIQQS